MKVSSKYKCVEKILTINNRLLRIKAFCVFIGTNLEANRVTQNKLLPSYLKITTQI